MASGKTSINMNDLNSYKSKLISEATTISKSWATFNANFAGLLNNGLIDGSTKVKLSASIAKASKEAAKVILGFDKLKDYINNSVKQAIETQDSQDSPELNNMLNNYNY